MDVYFMLQQNREQEAERIFLQYRRLLVTVARAVLRDYPEDCEECVQDAVWDYVNHRERLDTARGGEKTYLCVMVRSRALDRRRRLCIGRTEPIEDHACTLTAADETESTAVREGLRRALARLEPAERQLFTLRFLYEWSSAEIGRELHLTSGAVDARVSRLRKKLRPLLEEQGLGMREKEEKG
ncbi:sigma-70 family RNA polymerase sigma factor [Clostridium sp. D33t1_170424_F3]|uniref:RNA polymerase sigma factor n=1 Tax=Clostridium sp. D33t1_170424_F3 TaxID=2787099 RepID=UPI0025702107|nr:sigma-70 family RNA polymerase sigma factor [Clostridium sp. D33t1_170424_F3]